MAYQTLMSANLFANNDNPNPHAPYMGNGKVRVEHDIPAGSIVRFSLFKNTDQSTGQTTVSLAVSRKTDQAPQQQTQQNYQQQTEPGFPAQNQVAMPQSTPQQQTHVDF